MRKNIHLTYSRTMSSKNPEKSLQRSESHLFKNKQTAQAIDEDEEDALFKAGEFGDSNPVALQRTVWWFLSLHFGFRARDESSTTTTLIDQPSDPLLSATAPIFTGANIGSISGCTFQIFQGNVKIVQNERKRRIVIDSDEDD